MKNLILIGMLVGLTAQAADTELEKQCKAGDVGACQKDYQQHFAGKNGVTKPDTWWAWNGTGYDNLADSFKITQFFNGFAIFRSTAKPYGIAVRGSELGDQKIGNPLPWSISHACLKYGGEADMQTDRGEKLNILIYRKVACPEGL